MSRLRSDIVTILRQTGLLLLVLPWIALQAFAPGAMPSVGPDGLSPVLCLGVADDGAPGDDASAPCDWAVAHAGAVLPVPLAVPAEAESAPHSVAVWPQRSIAGLLIPALPPARAPPLSA